MIRRVIRPPLAKYTLRVQAVIADKACDADALVQFIRAVGAKAVIPPHSNRVNKRRYSRALYRTRNLIERSLTVSSIFAVSPLATTNWRIPVSSSLRLPVPLDHG
jgi:transposase